MNNTSNMRNVIRIFKHEFLMSRILVILSSCVLALLVIFMIAKNNEGSSFLLASLIILSWFTFITLAGSYFISATISFYHGVFGKNAYLTHSLPVSIDAIILSKIFVFTCWGIVMILEWAMFVYLISSLTNETQLLTQYLHDTLGGFSAIIKSFITYICVLTNEIIYIFMIISIVHRKRSWTLVYGIFVYFAIKILFIIIGSFVSYSIKDIPNDAIYIVSMCIIIVISILYYLVIRYIITRKLLL